MIKTVVKSTSIVWNTKLNTDVYENIKTKITITPEQVKELAAHVIHESYVIFAGKLFYQKAGIRMGGNASPVIADVVLSTMEFMFLQKTSIPKSASVVRYVDDILSVNVDIEDMIRTAYHA